MPNKFSPSPVNQLEIELINAGNQLEIELINAGNQLLNLRSSSPDFYSVLAKLKETLSEVEQMPSESLKNALDPVIQALVSDKLVKHPHIDVNILVACCFCEILRITAPDAPCNYVQLKDFFEMVADTFEKLSSESRGCYARMGRVLNLCSRNRLCVLMLDLGLEGERLIVRLFKQFLTVADSNSFEIVLEMEKIMTMVIEESEGLKLELVDVLVNFLKKKDQNASQDRWQLGVKVLMNFVARYKPRFANMGYTVRNALYKYSISVASICNTEIKMECQETIMPCHEELTNSLYDSSNSATEVTRKRQRNNSPVEKQVSSSEEDRICVHGYKVKQSVAEILEAIFVKHGDITANCMFKTSFVISSILEAVCEVVRRIQTNEVVEQMNETEGMLSDAEAANIDVAWLRDHLEAIRKKTEALERSNLLKKTSKLTLLTGVSALKDLRETDADFMAALERVRQVEKTVKVLDAFDKNLEDKLLECKAKLDTLDSLIQQPLV